MSGSPRPKRGSKRPRARFARRAFRPIRPIGVEIENFPRSNLNTPFHRTEATLYLPADGGARRQARGADQCLARRSGSRPASPHRPRARPVPERRGGMERGRGGRGIGAASRPSSSPPCRRSRSEVRRRVEAARDPLFAGARVDTQVIQAEIAFDQARLVADNARRALAAYWSNPSDQPLDVGEFENTDVELPVLAGAERRRLALLEAMRETADAQIAVEQSRAVPDLTLRGGVRYIEDGRDLAFVVGGSLPIGIYDTNRGNIERAEAERLAADREIAAARLARVRDTVRLQARIEANAAEAIRIESRGPAEGRRDRGAGARRLHPRRLQLHRRHRRPTRADRSAHPAHRGAEGVPHRSRGAQPASPPVTPISSPTRRQDHEHVLSVRSGSRSSLSLSAASSCRVRR